MTILIPSRIDLDDTVEQEKQSISHLPVPHYFAARTVQHLNERYFVLSHPFQPLIMGVGIATILVVAAVVVEMALLIRSWAILVVSLAAIPLLVWTFTSCVFCALVSIRLRHEDNAPVISGHLLSKFSLFCAAVNRVEVVRITRHDRRGRFRSLETVEGYGLIAECELGSFLVAYVESIDALNDEIRRYDFPKGILVWKGGSAPEHLLASTSDIKDIGWYSRTLLWALTRIFKSDGPG